MIGEVGSGEIADDDTDDFGRLISLSADGNIVAIGGAGPPNIGRVRVLRYHNEQWTKLGDDFEGDVGQVIGTSLDLSADGTVLAIGISQYDDIAAGTMGKNVGKVSIYKYVSERWVEVGDGITGNRISGAVGQYLSLTADGTTVAVAVNSSPNGKYSGHVEVHTTGA
jgi:hypothetical protein